MARNAIVYAIPAVLAAAAGIFAGGLLSTPVATDYQASGCFMTTDGSQCVDLPDPTSVGCPAGDFQCYFDKKMKDQPPQGSAG